VGPANQLVRSLLWRDLYPVRFKFSTWHGFSHFSRFILGFSYTML
jgi:hypothetical protein